MSNPVKRGTFEPMRTLDHDDARISLVGAVIKQAVRDCYNPHRLIRSDARDFVFSARIYKFLKHFHMENLVNVEYIRNAVRKHHTSYFIHEEHYQDQEETPVPV